jgi:hypothetical protein
MSIRTNGPGGRIPEPLNSFVSLGRRDYNSAVNPIKSCGHHRPIFRNVVAPGGSAGYLCRDCFAHLRAVEVSTVEVEAVRRELASLFKSWPLGAHPGAFVAIGEGGAA